MIASIRTPAAVHTCQYAVGKSGTRHDTIVLTDPVRARGLCYAGPNSSNTRSTFAIWYSKMPT